MNSMLTFAADAPLMRLARATKAICPSDIAALLALISPGVFAAGVPVRGPAPVPPAMHQSPSIIRPGLGDARETGALTDRSVLQQHTFLIYRWWSDRLLLASFARICSPEWMFDGNGYQIGH
jgi:hypothetical protein